MSFPGDNILDVIAAWERKKIAERMNRGKRRKAREGKVVAGPRPNYGFRFNEKRDGYLVDEDKMIVVKRIFRMAGAEGMTLNATRRALEREGIPTSRGRRAWSRQYLRDCIYDDAYLSHTYEEISQLVTSEVAASLDPAQSYGVWWYGTERHVHAQRREVAPDGTPRYKRVKKSIPAPREEWIAVPVPDAGIPKEWVVAAREAIKDNEWVSNAGDRVWELTGGVLRCAACGYAMATNYFTTRETGYYRCGRRYRLGVPACSQGKSFRAVETEALVWGFVSGMLKDPTRLEHGLNEMLEQEKALLYRGPGEDEEMWLKKRAELEVQEERLLDLYLENKLEVDRYESRAAQIKQWRRTVEDELARIKGRAAHLEQLERDRDALLNHYSRIVPERLDALKPDERNRVYKLLGLKALARENGDFEVKWALDGAPCGDNEPLLPGSCRTRGR